MRNQTSALCLLALAAALLLAILIGMVSAFIEGRTNVAEPKTCTRVYDRRDAPGSITITWDDPRVCRRA